MKNQLPCRPRPARISEICAANNPGLLVFLKRVGKVRILDKYFRLPKDWPKVSTAIGTCSFYLRPEEVPAGLTEAQLENFLLARGRERFPIAAPFETAH